MLGHLQTSVARRDFLATSLGTAAALWSGVTCSSSAESPSSAATSDGLLLTLNVPPGAGDRFQHAKFTAWLPDPARPVRALIIHQHGCGNVSPAHAPIAFDFHWRALARKNDCALLAPQYRVKGECDEWNDPDSGSERALFAALADFAKRAGRPELSDVPWVLWGHSGGSSWSAQMIVRHPGRVLAASFRGGCHKQFGVPEFRARFGPIAQQIPLLFVWGKRETVPTSKHHVSWLPMNTMYRELRAIGGRVARVIDPRSEHGCDDSRLLIIPFFDAVLAARFAGEPLPGALVAIDSLEIKEMTTDGLRDPALAWLPSARLAEWWREFSTTGTIRPAAARLATPVLTATREIGGRVRLNWSVAPELHGGLRMLRFRRDGELWKEIGVKPGDLIATGRDSPPESLREASTIDDTLAADADPTYTLTFLDAAGNESPASIPARAATTANRHR